MDKARALELRRFLTLTLDPRHCTAEQSVHYLRNCWNKFRTSLKRRAGKSISYIAVIEFQKNGYAHLHVLVDRFLPQPWIQSAWQAVGGGRFVNIQQVDIQRVGAYLSKYLTKDLFSMPGKQRRCTTSRDIVLFEKQHHPSTSDSAVVKWLLIKAPIEVIRNMAGSLAREVQLGPDGVLESFLSPVWVLR